MNAPDWWTAADQAELDVRIMETVDQVTDCQHPIGGVAQACPGCRESMSGLVEWRDRRILRSKAEYERAFADHVLEHVEQRLAA